MQKSLCKLLVQNKVELFTYEDHFLMSPLAPQCVAWHSEDKPFAVGYPSGKILLSTTETYENEQPIVLSLFQVCHPHSAYCNCDICLDVVQVICFYLLLYHMISFPSPGKLTAHLPCPLLYRTPCLP